MAREFDAGMTGPPLSISMDFIANGMVEMIGGVTCAAILAGYAWWAPIVLAGAWLGTHWLLRECDLARPQHGGGPQRAAGCRLRISAGRGAAGE